MADEAEGGRVPWTGVVRATAVQQPIKQAPVPFPAGPIRAGLTAEERMGTREGKTSGKSWANTQALSYMLKRVDTGMAGRGIVVS